MTRIKLNGVVGEIDSLPGCGQVAVSHSVFIPGWSVADLQGRGKGTLANEMRCLYAFEQLGYDAIVCTVDAANEAQKRVLTKNEWQKAFEFKSRKTGHTVEFWYKVLSP